MKVHDISPNLLMEEKIPEYVLETLELHFNKNKGKFKSASEKFITVRDHRVRMTNDPTTKKFMSMVTPAMFFRYKKGVRDMIEPEPSPVSLPKEPASKPVSGGEIPFNVDTTGEFTALPLDLENKHSIPEIIQYYKNTYYNSIPTNELAKKIAFSHFSHTDDVNSKEVEEMINNAKLHDSIKKRLPDEMVISKSLEHYGIKSIDELQDIAAADYSDVKEKIKNSWVSSMKATSPLPYAPKRYNQDIKHQQFYAPLIDNAKSDIVRAYLKRNATELKYNTIKLQVIRGMYERKIA